MSAATAVSPAAPMMVGWKTRLMAFRSTSATSAGSPGTSEMRFRNDTEQPVHELPMSQITDGAAGLASASLQQTQFEGVQAEGGGR